MNVVSRVKLGERGGDFTHLGIKESIDYTAAVTDAYKAAVERKELGNSTKPDGLSFNDINGQLDWQVDKFTNIYKADRATGKFVKETMNEVDGCESKPTEKKTQVQKKVERFIDKHRITPKDTSHVNRTRECPPCDSTMSR